MDLMKKVCEVDLDYEWLKRLFPQVVSASKIMCLCNDALWGYIA